jgi:hypothetical protein
MAIPRSVLVLLLGVAAASPLRAQAIFANGFEGDAPAGNATSGLGTNLEGVEDFAAAYPFTNVFKQSRPWVTGAQFDCVPPATPGASCFDTLQADQLDLDGDGYARALPPCPAATGSFCNVRAVMNSADADHPAGTYLVLYEGSGSFSYIGATRDPVASAPGREVVTVPADSQWILTIESTAPAPNHVRNLRVLAPGFDPAVAPVPTFHPDFIARLAPYRTLRFMDWMRTNGGGFGGAPNAQVDFADRALPSHATFAREAGVPLEVMIELANVADAEPWFTLPHQVSDAYVTAFAQMVLARLDAGRRVYVEHSNEVWNEFPQGFDVENAAQATFPGGAESGFTKRMNQHGLRTRRLCDLFRTVFGSQSGRIVCSFGAQSANTFTGEEAARCPLAVSAALVSGSCSLPGDAYAIAPYFGNYLDGRENEDEVQGWTLDNLFDEINDGGQLLDANANGLSPNPPDADDVQTPCTTFPPGTNVPPCLVSALDEVVPWIEDYRDSADAAGLRLIAYEGGQHLVGILGVENNDAITDLFVAANRDARMGVAYASYLQSWKDAGGELFVHFQLSNNHGKFGSWGAIESLTQTPDPPKQQAILSFIAANPCWWSDCAP